LDARIFAGSLAAKSAARAEESRGEDAGIDEDDELVAPQYFGEFAKLMIFEMRTRAGREQ
jgi:hypothetical protein